MAQLCGEFRFGQKHVDERGGGAEMGPNSLDDDVLLETLDPGVSSQKHFGHAADTDLLEQLITSESFHGAGSTTPPPYVVKALMRLDRSRISEAMSDEIELKLLLDGIEEYDRVSARLGNRLDRLEQTNMYFDTPDSDLAQHRWALRARKENERIRLTLKGEGRSEGDFTVRAELESEVPLNSWVAIIRGEYALGPHIEAMLRGSEVTLPVDIDLGGLETLGTTTNVRSVYALPGSGDPLMVELDETEYPDFSIVYEVELEVPDGSSRREATQRLKDVFNAAQVPWRPSAMSKLERFRTVLESLLAKDNESSRP